MLLPEQQAFFSSNLLLNAKGTALDELTTSFVNEVWICSAGRQSSVTWIATRLSFSLVIRR
jgi:hypothetical protein